MGSTQAPISDLISVPKGGGGGAMSGLGETFQPDLHTGTGNFSVPITLPLGRNGLTPQIKLSFSTGAGNGPSGQGWSMGVPGIAQSTKNGVPLYNATDVFVLSGTEELVAIARDPQAGTTRYRPRTEGLFARITRHAGADGGYWLVETKDGLTSVYGSPGVSATPFTGSPRAVIADPDNPSHVFAWRLNETRDPLGNRIVYDHRHDGTQIYLKRIRYADLPERGPDAFLMAVDFVYDDEPVPTNLTPEVPIRARPDAFSDCRAGFEIRTQRRCKWIVVNSNAEPGRVIPIRAYELVYLDEQLASGLRTTEPPANGVSLLARINVIGFDDAGIAHREMPPLDFGYTTFSPKQRRFKALGGSALPLTSLANPDLELVSLFGNGLLDIVEMGPTSVRYWRNLGDGQFDLPRPFAAAPAAWRLADAGVQLIDANGDGRADLLITTSGFAGYWPLDFRGGFSQRSYRRYSQAPSFNLEDTEVRLLDLTGDGVTDVLRSASSFECFFNDPVQGFTPERTARIPRGSAQDFPDVSFSDPRVKVAALNGDGLQGIALVHQSRVDYWPSHGYGRFGRRRSMALPAGNVGLPFQFDPARVLLGDVDGDGLADLLYVSDRSVTLWINQAGNGWSEPICIQGTPAVDNLVTVRLVDLHGTGVAGLLWTRDAGSDGAARHYYLDFTGGTKPYLLNRMDNHMGAVTEVEYAPSTRYYLRDERSARTRWRTTLPMPVQVVESVTVRDAISGGNLSTEYRYHHGYWDGVEREFRGFGMVETIDRRVFSGYLGRGLEPDSEVVARLRAQLSSAPPVLMRSWFHQGPVDPPDDARWSAPDPRDEYWPGDSPLLDGLWQTEATLAALPPAARREALRTLRGSLLRSETYALDGSPLEERPYSVTEYAYGLTEIAPPAANSSRRSVFFPHPLAQRTTQWERGDDPATRFAITGDYDEYGQPRRQLSIACPRGWRGLDSLPAEPYLATLSVTTFATPTAAGPFFADRVVRARTYELTGTSGQAVGGLFGTTESTGVGKRLFAESLNYFDGPAFEGLPFGSLGAWGVVVRSESLVLTEDLLTAAYGGNRPPWLDANAAFTGGGDYPQEFADRLPANAGYRYRPANQAFSGGWYVQATRSRFDFQEPVAAVPPRGMVLAQLDPLGHETRISYDALRLLPEAVRGPTGLTVRAEYNHRVFMPSRVTDPNGNRTDVRYSPSGLVTDTFIRGKAGQQEGDENLPSTSLSYDLRAFLERGQPVYARAIRRVFHDTDPNDTSETIEVREYSDGFGRLLQTRTQGEAIRFGHVRFGDDVLGLDQSQGSGGNLSGIENTDTAMPNVTVSGWQVYDDKGRVLKKYEPFFDTGWDYQPNQDGRLGQCVQLFYDALGRTVRTLNPDQSEQRVIHGIPLNLADPPLNPLDTAKYRPTPWEAYTYDANDNAGRTHAGVDPHTTYPHHTNTPASAEVDALGRAVRAVARHREPPDGAGNLLPIEEHVTRSTYDIQGNLIGIRDALGRLAFEYTYDLAKHPLHTQSIDAGPKWVVFDAAGNALEARDAKGALQLHGYDALNRPIRLWARDAIAGPMTLRERMVYGDDPVLAAGAAASNRLGKLAQHDDEAGRVAVAAYDFKGNILQTTRQVLSDDFLLKPYRDELTRPEAERTWALSAPRVDWAAATADTELGPSYLTRSAYDALNRAKWSDYPQAANGERYRLRPDYNRAGGLERVALVGPLDANDQGAAQTYVERISYNAKGQRTLIAYGNGIVTRYAYEPATFRLLRMRTDRYSIDAADPLTYRFSGAPLQDITYRYDLTGNILTMQDVTPGCGVANNPDALVRRFQYDPLYRLTSATGREATNFVSPRPWEDLPRYGYNSGKHGTPNQDNAPNLTAFYLEEFAHDAAGNMLTLWHSQRAPGVNGDWQVKWSRRFGMDGYAPDDWRREAANHLVGDWPNAPSNRLTHVEDRRSGVPSGPTVPKSHWFDANGNMTREYNERLFEWDHADRMKSFRNQTGASKPSVYAVYLYNASGQRVKKLVVTDNGQGYRTTTCLGAAFEHHTEQKLDGSGKVENCSLHVMDDKARIAIDRVGPAFEDDGAKEHSLQYHIGDHLGSSCLVISGEGDWINREEFFPYGGTSFGSFGRKRYSFSGKERDEESGLNYHSARYFSNWLYRWMTCDPLRETGGQNLFEYCGGNPLIRIDPDGRLFWVVVIVAAVVLLKNHEEGGGREEFAAVALGMAAPAEVVGLNAGLSAGKNFSDAQYYADELNKLPQASSQQRESLEKARAESARAGVADVGMGLFAAKLAGPSRPGRLVSDRTPRETPPKDTTSIPPARQQLSNTGDIVINPSRATPLDKEGTTVWADILSNDWAATQATRTTNSQRPRAAGVSIDVADGQIRYGTSGEFVPAAGRPTPPIDPSMPRVPSLEGPPGLGRPPEQCAEFALRNRVEAAGANITDQVMSVRDVKNFNPATNSAPLMPACHNCQVTSAGATFTAGCRN